MPARLRRAGALAAAAAALIAVPSASAAPAERAFALSDGTLLSFDPSAPAAATATAITGVTAGETLVGLDARPQNGMLYALGVNAVANTGTLYVVGRDTAFASPVGTASSLAFTTNGVTAVDLPAGDYGFDVNPSADLIRVSTASGLNFRINPNTGLGIDGDNGGGATTGTNPDGPINGATTGVGGSAYTNDVPNNGGITTLYALSAATDQLTIQNPANAGTQTGVGDVTLGGTPVNFSAVGGFDIAPGVDVTASGVPATAGVGHAALTVGGATHLYTVALATGALTDLGPLGSGTAAIQGLALQRDLDDAGYPVVGLAADGLSLRRFAAATPGTVVAQAVSGVAAGETLVDVAWRPATGQLLGLGVNAAADTGTLYVLDPQTGAATAIGAPGSIAYTNGAAVDLPASGWGMDVNPNVDRVRLVTATGLNARVNPATGLPIDSNAGASGTNPDASANGLPPGATGVSAASYTNAFTQAPGGTTTLYVLEPFSNQLGIQNPPNNGTFGSGLPASAGGVPLDFATVAALDIPSDVAVATSNAPATGTALAALHVGTADGVYALDLATGAATLLGAAPAPLASIAVGDAQRDLPRTAPPPGDGTTPPVIATPLPAPPTPPAPDRTAPKITRLSLTASRRRKLTLTFTTSEGGRATIRVLRELPGRRAGKRCTTKRRTGRRCLVRRAYASSTRTVATGKVTITLKGRLGVKRLPLGAVRVEITVRDAAGNASAVVGRSIAVRP